MITYISNNRISNNECRSFRQSVTKAMAGADSERPVFVSCIAKYSFGESLVPFVLQLLFLGWPGVELQQLDLNKLKLLTNSEISLVLSRRASFKTIISPSLRFIWAAQSFLSGEYFG